jgi:putative sigma-54 modulation protein
MEVLVRNAEGNVANGDRDYAAKKLGRLDRYFHLAQRVEMVHREEKLGHRIEITVFADGMTFRGEETDSSLRAAIDKVHDKLEVRMNKFKSRLIDRHRKRGVKTPPAFESEAPDPADSDHKPLSIRERKQFLLKPMSREEAALQMEMIDHSFFIFKNEENEQIEVLYKRKDGKYGLLQPEM